MSFGDFAMGYLLGQSFSGPSSAEPVMVPGKCQGDLDAEKDPDVIAAGEKAYWEAWDKACKEGVIKRLRDPNDDLRFSPVTYPDISKEKWADLIESGEVKIVAPTHLTPTSNGEQHGLAYMWADENREEARRPAYRDNMPEFLKERVEKSFYRIIQ